MKVAPQSWLSRMEIVNLGNVAFVSKGLWVPIKTHGGLSSFFQRLKFVGNRDLVVDSMVVSPGQYEGGRGCQVHQAHQVGVLLAGV